MSVPPGHLNKLIVIPELYPIIANHLPLYTTAPTLLSLALTNRHNAEVVLPILNSRLILKSNEDAIIMLRKVNNNPAFGLLVRELHIMFHELDGSQPHDPSLDVLALAQDVILTGHLPHIHTFEMNFLGGWDTGNERYDNEYTNLDFYRFREGFFLRLREQCPRLTEVILRGLQDGLASNSWIEKSGLLEMPADILGLQELSLRMHGTYNSVFSNLIDNLSLHAQSLHTLELALPVLCDSYYDATDILKLTFPSLTIFSLECFDTVDTRKSMAFFERHPCITHLNIAGNKTEQRWFTVQLPSNFLPNLRHLVTSWYQAKLLSPLFVQLHSLCIGIDYTYNAQIPYLLRAVISTPLLKLRSLEIGQVQSEPTPYEFAVDRIDRRNFDISRAWYETEEGTFKVDAKEASRTVYKGYLHSIVRAAPNLEELGFHHGDLELSKFCLIADDLNRFKRLKHLHYQRYGYTDNKSDQETFAAQARELAEAVPGLLSITEAGDNDLPYLTARIERTDDGRIANIVVGNGFGMKVGRDNVAFPRAPYDFGGSLG